MKILLTNDDGYNAPGIKMMQKVLSKYGTVIILAPDVAWSAKSVSLTIGEPLKLTDHGNNVFSLSGSPADCVAFALSSFKVNFDLVVSGCNNGLNLSYDTIYSGTIGACLEALVFRKKCMAVSCDVNAFDIVEENFDLAWKYIEKKHLLSTRYLLNINFPKEDVLGVDVGKLYYRKDNFYFTKEGDGYYAYRSCETDFEKHKNTDCYQVEHGIISIVPLDSTCYNEDIYNELKTR